MTVIEFDNAGFAYDGGARALDGISLRIDAGEFVCVCGGNGSGKTTFAKHVNALLVPDGGTVRVLGHDTRDEGATFAIRSGAGMVFQNPDDQIVASIVEDDVAFGPGNLGVEGDELRERVARALERVGLAGFEEAETSALSGGQKQLVAIAGALAMEPHVLVLDEPSAMLDPRGRDAVMRVCRELNDAGITIVYITHFMEEAACADRIVVLDRGHVALDGAPREVLSQVERLAELALEPPYAAQVSGGRYLTIDELLAAIAAGEFAAGDIGPDKARDAVRGATAGSRQHPRPPEAHAHPPELPEASELPDPPEAPRPAVAFEDATYEYPAWALRDITLDVREGEIFGIAGHTGSGKSTLIQLAGGLLKPTAGTVAFGERREIGVVFQYPERQLFAATVFDDVAFGPRNLGLPSDEVETRVADALSQVHLDPDGLRDTSPFSLSGGMQRRVAIAGVLAMRPRVLILDEPTAGLDPRARKALLGLVRELHGSGITVAIVSHDMDDLARLCDRVAVLNDGRLEIVGTPEEVFADEGRMRAIGLDIPQFMQLARALER